MVGNSISFRRLLVWTLPRREFHTCGSLGKQKLTNLKGKKVAEQKWITRQLSDPYVKKAQAESYRCRSAFKLTEIDDKHKILKPGQVVIDCGAAPGSWCQVAVQRVNSAGHSEGPRGLVIGVDLQHMMPIQGATLLHQSDFTLPETQEKIVALMNGMKADVVISDMAPNPIGVKSVDHTNAVKLCKAALKFAAGVLKLDGTFLCKLWEGNERSELENLMKMVFGSVRTVKPLASRTDSAEIFLLARKFQGIPQR